MTPEPAKPDASSASSSKPARKGAKKSAATTKRAAKTPPAKKAPAKPPTPEPEVRAVDTESAKRAGIYLHPDDWRALQEARLNDGADMNARIRAMIALWRHDSEHGFGRIAARIDRLARTAPRGGQGRRG